MDGCGNVRKTRGRPRKYGPMLDPTPQKKRGRPRLADVEELPLSVHTVVSDDDLLTEILVRLPVVSLVLFKSVSKHWLKKTRGRPRKKRGRPRLADVETTATDLWELSPNTLGGNEELPLSAHKVVSDDDLLNQILVRLPVLSLVLFKSVSKRWLSLIKDAAFLKRRNRVPNIDPPSGLCIERDWKNNVYGFAPLDIRIRPRLKNTFKTEHGNATVLQSCNGLFLCFVKPGNKYCVCNPTLNLFKMLPEPLYYDWNRYAFTSMDFDPTKSPHYKVVHATILGHDYRFRIQTYSSETGIWSIVCSSSDPIKRVPFEIYWNGAIHRIKRDLHHKLDFVNKSGILTKIQVPVTMDNYCKLFESRGCLLLLDKDKTHSDQLNVYEMRIGDFEWLFKYSVNLSRITLDGVWCISLGEREEDLFMVIEVNGKVGLYKLLSKDFRGLPEWQLVLPERRYSSEDSFLFIPSFASV